MKRMTPEELKEELCRRLNEKPLDGLRETHEVVSNFAKERSALCRVQMFSIQSPRVMGPSKYMLINFDAHKIKIYFYESRSRWEIN